MKTEETQMKTQEKASNLWFFKLCKEALSEIYNKFK